MFSESLDQSAAEKRRCPNRFSKQSKPKRRLLHVPRTVCCPRKLQPIRPDSVQTVPFAKALEQVRSRQLADFMWMDKCQVNNHSGETSSRRMATMEAAKRELDNWIFLFFRIRRANYEKILKVESIGEDCRFNKDFLDKWTHKFKFKIRRSAPIKLAINAFASRMGVKSDCVYCTDGFYGDRETGQVDDPKAVPYKRVSLECNAIGLQLKNYCSIFVNMSNSAAHSAAMEQLKADTNFDCSLAPSRHASSESSNQNNSYFTTVSRSCHV